MKNIRKMIYLSLLVAVALALSVVESALPVIAMIPGAKLGLSNIVTLTIIMVYGLKDTLVVTSLKSILLVLITGSVTGFFYSFPSGIASALIMYVSYEKFSKKRNVFSPIGVSILGAVTHNIVQVSVASILLSNSNIFIYLPILLLISLITGYFVGLAADFISEKLRINLKVVGD